MSTGYGLLKKFGKIRENSGFVKTSHELPLNIYLIPKYLFYIVYLYRNGCEVFLDQAELDDHQKNCLYRPINCPYNLSCNEKVIFLHLEDHLAKGGFS